MHPFSGKISVKKENLLKLNNKHELAQLGRLNIVLNVEKAFYDS